MLIPCTPLWSQAVFNLDYSQFKLVFEALHERNHLLTNVPFLAHPLPIMTVRRRQRLQHKAAQRCAVLCCAVCAPARRVWLLRHSE